MSQNGKGFKQRYYGNINTLSLCRPVLLSGTLQSEHVAAGEMFQTTILSETLHLSFCRPVLLSGNVQSEHVAAGERFQTTILWEH